MRILVATDSFKDALSAPDVCDAIVQGLAQGSRAYRASVFPLADGGEGTVDVIRAHRPLSDIPVDIHDPLGRPLRAHFSVDATDNSAFVELANASGLQRLALAERDPRKTSTFGCGQLIAAAMTYGVERIVLTIGGSATNDGGIGIAAALGWRFLDNEHRDVPPVGGHLLDIKQIVPPAPRVMPKMDVLCDVTNPLFGPQGAAHMFAKQKGADDLAIEQLDAGLRYLARLVERQRLADVSPAARGAGAAGGVGYGAMVFLHAQLHRGAEYVLDLTRFDAALDEADLLITGEGRLDGQTAHGKLIQVVCQRAARKGIPVIALCGELLASPQELQSIGLHAAYSINKGASADDALRMTRERLVATASRLPLP